ncbi:hypothetical protein [Citrobacter braakii]|uniref:hypothetical protein n=1 Tax=Citrobacter braakii TaxID=57706 RepID=UPI000543CD25|nr:hypothetical protein [Citrobacter braakii]KHE05310.1 hypothetical protein IB70_15975 [Citrobacter braakii]
MEMNIKTLLIRALCGSLITLLLLAGILSVYIYGKGIDAIAICIAFYAVLIGQKREDAGKKLGLQNIMQFSFYWLQ